MLKIGATHNLSLFFGFFTSGLLFFIRSLFLWHFLVPWLSMNVIQFLQHLLFLIIRVLQPRQQLSLLLFKSSWNTTYSTCHSRSRIDPMTVFLRLLLVILILKLFSLFHLFFFQMILFWSIHLLLLKMSFSVKINSFPNLLLLFLYLIALNLVLLEYRQLSINDILFGALPFLIDLVPHLELLGLQTITQRQFIIQTVFFYLLHIRNKHCLFLNLSYSFLCLFFLLGKFNDPCLDTALLVRN